MAFGVYGALHSSLVAATLRTPQPLPRKLLFVVLTAVLSMLSAMLALYGSRYVGGFPGMSGLRLLVTLAAGLGAASYAVLVRRFWVRELTLQSVVSITLGCMLATSGPCLSPRVARGWRPAGGSPSPRVFGITTAHCGHCGTRPSGGSDVRDS